MFPIEVVQMLNREQFIGIRLSGGIDSAVLCYIVLKYFPHVKIIPITFINKLRPNAINSVNNVLKILKDLNPNNQLLEQEIGYFDTTGYVVKKIRGTTDKINPKDIFQKQFIKDLFKKYQGNLNLILSGETLNPPMEDQILLGLAGEFPADRNRGRWQLLEKYIADGTEKFEYRPFRNSNKKQVAEVCKELNLMETLFPFTETCETETEKYKKYENRKVIEYVNPGVEPCQCCWPCGEKYWAYGVFDFNTKKRTTK